MTGHPIATAAEFPTGLRCADCQTDLTGRPYTDRIEGMTDGPAFVTPLICTRCEAPGPLWRLAARVLGWWNCTAAGRLVAWWRTA